VCVCVFILPMNGIRVCLCLYSANEWYVCGCVFILLMNATCVHVCFAAVTEAVN